MSDLREALDKYDDTVDSPWYLPPWSHTLAAAARAVADGKPIWWCEAHDSVAVTPGHRCDHAKLIYARQSEVSGCERVPARIVVGGVWVAKENP